MRTLILILSVWLCTAAVVEIAAAQSICTTSRNAFTGAVETHCSDGSSSTSTRNPFTGNVDTSIQPGPPRYPSPPYQQAPQPRPQRCTTSRNAFTGALETVCY
jgi:hypothetical protein